MSENSNVTKARSLALQGALFAAVLVLVSLIPVRIGPLEFGMGFIPLIAIFLWPRGASKGTSYILIFIVGILADILGDGPVGLWSLTYLSFYGVLEPDQRRGEVTLGAIWLRFAGWIFIVTGMLVMISLMFVSGKTPYLSLLMQAIAGVLAFPVFFGIRQLLRNFVTEPDERGYT